MLPVSFSPCWLLDSMVPRSYEQRAPQGLHGARCRRCGARFFPCRPSSSRFRVLLDTSGREFLACSGLRHQCNSPCLPYRSLLSEKMEKIIYGFIGSILFLLQADKIISFFAINEISK